MSTTCFLFRYIQFYVHTLVTTLRRSPRAGTSRQSGQNIWRSQNAVSPEKACWKGRETMLIDDIDNYDENTLSVGVSSPPARLKSVGKRRNFLTWAALLTTLQIGECCSHSHWMEITLIYVADADIMTIAVTVISEPFVDSIKSLLNGGSHFDAVLFNNLWHENTTTTTTTTTT